MKIGDGLRGFCLVCSSLPSHCAWKMVRRPESVVCSNQLIIPRQTQAARPRRLPEFGSAAAAGRSAASFHIHRLSTSSPPPSSAPDVRGTLGTLIRNLNKRDKQAGGWRLRNMPHKSVWGWNPSLHPFILGPRTTASTATFLRSL